MRNPDRTRALPRSPLARLCLAALVALVCGVGCGKEIGDECVIASDCSPNGDRQCIVDQTTKDGYCTIQGCSFNSCPEEAVCVRFFTGTFANARCDYDPEVNDPLDPEVPIVCSLDELCAVNHQCAPRSSEIRFCMRECGSDDDCRDGYECRDFDRMKEHGGEPVLDQGQRVTSASPKFCAARGS